MRSRDFRIVCDDTGNGVLKPFLTYNIRDPTKLYRKAEVLNISLEHGEARVLHPISSYCYNPTSGKMETDKWHWNLRSSYTFSTTANKFTVVGCRTLAFIGDPRKYSAMYETGCVAMCFQGKMALNPCSGMGCCQTAIPQGLRYYKVWFDQRLNTSGIDDGMGLIGPCGFAVLMDSSNFTSSTSSSNNISSPEFIKNNSPSAFNSSRGGKAPVVLDWSIGYYNCATAQINPGYACVGNSFCSDAASGRGYICECKPGFQGNPYLPNDDGCQGELSTNPSFLSCDDYIYTSRAALMIFGYSLLRYI
jgi:hypothetical protein